MYNFAGKSLQAGVKTPTEVNFTTFWKSIDDFYFTHLAPNSLEHKTKDLMEKIIYFTQNHHRGSFSLIENRSGNSFSDSLRVSS